MVEEKDNPGEFVMSFQRKLESTDMSRKAKILVAMSGGVDSSVAAALLVRAGYDVTGAFMVNYDDAARRGTERCWTGDYRDALRVAAKLGIKLLKLDFTREYKRDVLDNMYAQYKAGRTPNPDVLCNKYVKFGAWLNKARALGFDKLATGHYAICHSERRPKAGVEESLNARFRLMQSKDTNKDQTYFLHQLSQAQLRQVLFPIGGYTKPQVRALARKFALPTAEKEESMGICFIGEVPMKEFLMKKIKAKKGKILLSCHSRESGNPGVVIGKHDGLAFYTIGERVGINSKPYFVVDKNIKKNELIVGGEKDPLLYSTQAMVKNVNWISGRAPNPPAGGPLKCQTRLRHRQPLQDCVVFKNKITFTHPQRAVTPGQFAVFYLKDECLGGGVIS